MVRSLGNNLDLWGQLCGTEPLSSLSLWIDGVRIELNSDTWFRSLGRFDPWVGKIAWRGHGNPLSYSCLGNPMDRRTWEAVVHGVTKRWAQLK